MRVHAKTARAPWAILRGENLPEALPHDAQVFVLPSGRRDARPSLETWNQKPVGDEPRQENGENRDEQISDREGRVDETPTPSNLSAFPLRRCGAI